MKKNLSKIYFLTIGLFLAATVSYLNAWTGAPPNPPNDNTPTSSNKLSGYAWSDNIGWISFNDGNGVQIDSSGNLNGFAWSENIGWVKFGGLSSFPSSGNNAKLDGDNLTGWARACAGTVNGDCNSADRTDGWDGWISLSGPGYGVKLDRNSSYAWGSDVVGWIDFKGVGANVQNENGICMSGQVRCQGGDINNYQSTRNPDGSTTHTWICKGRGSGLDSGTCTFTAPPVVIPPTSSTSTVNLIMNPPIVNQGQKCTAIYTLTPAGNPYTCVLTNSLTGSVISTENNFQVSPGDYRIVCTNADGSKIQSPSRKCALNPTVNEI